MDQEQIVSLIVSFLTILVTVILIVFVKIYSKIPSGAIGPELNLLTYGTLWDLIISAMKGEDYWKNIEPTLLPYKSFILTFIVILNFVMMAWNFKLANLIEKKRSLSMHTKKQLKGVSLFLGLISLCFYTVFQVFWK
ncbi:hypothetical protein [Spirosoma validum]|uniref:Uncharacterized protein n=1 Tax=Spirosoma validum TaxID=2771355 RepID=A0A927GCG0_9BACT|nr:hypothetical protein [Spirosoma validum]MBD2752603.1 hypothetical protein [Spirosoma validum]